MKRSTAQRARKAGLLSHRCRRGTIWSDPLTGKSVYDGNRSTKSPRSERELESLIRHREKGGLD